MILLRIRRFFAVASLFAALPVAVSAQTLADRLGYPPGTKLIVVHADDLGETHAVNAAAIKALQGGTINSAPGSPKWPTTPNLIPTPILAFTSL